MSRHGMDQNDEMFLTSPSDRDPPTVSPLRIVKRDTPSPRPTAGNTTQPSAFSPPPQSPPPQNPLPYPDDRPRPHHLQSFSPSNTRPPYPDHGPLPSTVKQSSKPSSPHYSGSGGSSPADIPPSLRPRERRNSKTAQSSLAERRGTTGPKPLPESPILQTSDKEGLFQKLPQRPPGGGGYTGGMPEQRRNPSAEVNSYPDVPQQYWNSQSNAPASSSLAAPQPTHSVNRLGSTASTSTTKANRGSPPPPETPIVPPGRSDIESRYAAAGIAGTSTLTNLQAQSAAAQQRAQQYAAPQAQTHLSQPQNSTPRPWTPTELPGSQPHGPPTVYQGPVPTSVPPPQTSGPASHLPPGHPAGYHQNHNPLEEDFQRINLTASPPPAYSSLGGPGPGGRSSPPQ
ncbi:WW domain-containing protein [Histoplasma capsulatum H143]|uniref:WW domain-containing protein n=1 Tax=Ajellomyces capsulatus (strain H143) TaxID=544712 RepID=C6H8P0_AJECH|nr:WW domain-containing protein [Histoplasma capsulatum H143]